jgi:hypothetical protein
VSSIAASMSALCPQPVRIGGHAMKAALLGMLKRTWSHDRWSPTIVPSTENQPSMQPWGLRSGQRARSWSFRQCCRQQRRTSTHGSPLRKVIGIGRVWDLGPVRRVSRKFRRRHRPATHDDCLLHTGILVDVLVDEVRRDCISMNERRDGYLTTDAVPLRRVTEELHVNSPETTLR